MITRTATARYEAYSDAGGAMSDTSSIYRLYEKK